jgi:hypothetical protein
MINHYIGIIMITIKMSLFLIIFFNIIIILFIVIAIVTF